MGDVAWLIVAGTIGGLAILIYALMDTAKREDRNARQAECSANPLSDVTVTR